MNADAKLKLMARDEDDLTVLASCLQDALVPVQDMAYLPEERRFAMIANRFRWEEENRNERVNCAVTFEQVRKVRSRAIDRANKAEILDLLTLTVEDSGIMLVFAGGGLINLETEGISCFLRDVGEPWPTSWRPRHKDPSESPTKNSEADVFRRSR